MRLINSEFYKITAFSLEALFIRLVLICLVTWVLSIIFNKMRDKKLKETASFIKVNNIGNIRLVMILFLFMQYGALIFFGWLFLRGTYPSYTVVVNKIFDLSGLVSLLAVFALIFYLCISKKNMSFNALGITKKNVKKGLLWGISFFLLFFNFRIFMTKYFYVAPDNIITNLSALKIALTIGIAPVVEEVFYRGYIYGQLRRLFGVKLGSVSSALFFAIMHINWGEYVLVFILGIIFVFLYEKSGSLITSVIAHIVVNSLALVVSYRSGVILKNLTGPRWFLIIFATAMVYLSIYKYMLGYNKKDSPSSPFV